jgi:hypothetical protein
MFSGCCCLVSVLMSVNGRDCCICKGYVMFSGCYCLVSFLTSINGCDCCVCRGCVIFSGCYCLVSVSANRKETHDCCIIQRLLGVGCK